MKKLLSLATAIVILAGCATNDPYADRGNTDMGSPAIERGLEMNRDGTPGTHPNDPRAGVGIDDHPPTETPVPH